MVAVLTFASSSTPLTTFDKPSETTFDSFVIKSFQPFSSCTIVLDKLPRNLLIFAEAFSSFDYQYNAKD